CPNLQFFKTINNMLLKETLIAKLTGYKDPRLSFETVEYKGELTLIIPKEEILEVCRFLKNDPDLQFNLCEDVTAIDWARRKNRFTVVYHIFSIKNKFRLRIKADVDESDLTIDSVTS